MFLVSVFKIRKMDLSTISVEDKKAEKVCTVLQYYARKFLFYSFLELHADDIVSFCGLYTVLHPNSHCQLGLNNFFYINSVFYTLKILV